MKYVVTAPALAADGKRHDAGFDASAGTFTVR